MITKTRKIINAVSSLQNIKRCSVFNDKLKDGTRSVKVWGWTMVDYSLAKKMLMEAGLKVNLIVKQKQHPWSGAGVFHNVVRLHVVE